METTNTVKIINKKGENAERTFSSFYVENNNAYIIFRSAGSQLVCVICFPI